MNRHLPSASIVAAVLLASLLGSSATAQQDDDQRLVLAGYPDAAEWLAMDVLRRVADTYERENPGSTVELKPGLSCAEAREMVLSGEAAAIVISQQKDLVRAYHAQTGEKRGFSELELDEFYPVASRTIRSERGALGQFRLGLATHEVTEPLARFLAFLATPDAHHAVRQVPFMEPAERLREPTAVDKVPGSNPGPAATG